LKKLTNLLLYNAASGYKTFVCNGNSFSYNCTSTNKNSILDEYDLDGDDTITNEELQQAKEIKETETKLRKNLVQLRMAR